MGHLSLTSMLLYLQLEKHQNRCGSHEMYSCLYWEHTSGILGATHCKCHCFVLAVYLDFGGGTYYVYWRKGAEGGLSIPKLDCVVR